MERAEHPITTLPHWHQAYISLDDRIIPEQVWVTYIGPAMMSADEHGLLAAWFFARGVDRWVLRYLPATTGLQQSAREFIENTFNNLTWAGYQSRWAHNAYEPEVHALGGAEATDLAYRLFHQDSRYILDYLATDGASPPFGHGDKRRELSIYFCTALMRAAGQEWNEQGDVWARVAKLRALLVDERRGYSIPQQEIMIVATSASSRPAARQSLGGPFECMAGWLQAFSQMGHQLDILNREGGLTRGLRSVLAHHILSHWNRIGLPEVAQADIASAAWNRIMGD